MSHERRFVTYVLALFVAGTIFLTACAPATTPAATTETEVDALAPLSLPLPDAVALDGRPLRVVATTSIIGDVVSRIGGEAIDLTTLIGPGQDPHSYIPAAGDLTATADADLIVINGWDLEQGLVGDLESIGENAVIVPVSAGITPLSFGDHEGEEHDGEEHEHHHDAADPHVWLNVSNVGQWTDNIAATLAAMDPANEALYAANARAYKEELTALDAAIVTQLAAIPDVERVLVTNHDALGYFAAAYGFRVLGTIVPGGSTLSEPTASDLADLIVAMEAGNVCALFSESTVSDQLPRTLADELPHCDEVQVIQLFTDALSGPGGDADTYIDMMQTNVNRIVSGLE